MRRTLQLYVDGTDTAYQVVGEGADLLLLHGFLCGQAIFDEMLPQLSTSYRVTVVDMPGHGGTAALAGHPTMADYGRWLLHFVKAVGLDKPVAIGHSMGGYVVLAAAHQQMDAFSGLGLWHSTASADSPERKANREKGMNFIREKGLRPFAEGLIPQLFPLERQQFLPRAVEIAMQTQPMAAVAAVRAMKERSAHTALLKQLPYPLLFLHGWQDGVIPAADVQEQAILSARTMLVGLRRVAHMGMMEAPDDCSNALLSFMAFCGQRPQTT